MGAGEIKVGVSSDTIPYPFLKISQLCLQKGIYKESARMTSDLLLQIVHVSTACSSRALFVIVLPFHGHITTSCVFIPFIWPFEALTHEHTSTSTTFGETVFCPNIPIVSCDVNRKVKETMRLCIIMPFRVTAAPVRM